MDNAVVFPLFPVPDGNAVPQVADPDTAGFVFANRVDIRIAQAVRFREFPPCPLGLALKQPLPLRTNPEAAVGILVENDSLTSDLGRDDDGRRLRRRVFARPVLGESHGSRRQCRYSPGNRKKYAGDAK